MIYELKKERFDSIKDIVHKQWDNIEIMAVLSGINTGWVFVDSLETPATALLWSKGIEGFYFIGNPDNHTFNAEIIEFIINHLRFRIIQSGLNHFEFSGDCIMWDSVLEKIFNFKELIKSRQCVYQLDFDKWKYHKTNGLCKDTDIRKIDLNLIQSAEILNPEFVESEILRWWDSLDYFFEQAFGFCVIENKKIVSYCITNFVYQNTYTIGIETLEHHRRRGFSQMAAESFVSKLLEDGCEPYWDCMFTNTASRSLAEKLGFYLDHTYSLYRLPL
ncbi:MAG: GNAT family N-acetyltransferase [Blautia sp.]|jgi:RimJ/RimL family protein N-acetyltransferase|uniref:GNAT family N-acetyltransferase n=1 Tax=Blautia sp. TaxID=1955243 RepID=UPI003D949921